MICTAVLKMEEVCSTMERLSTSFHETLSIALSIKTRGGIRVGRNDTLSIALGLETKGGIRVGRRGLLIIP